MIQADTAVKTALIIMYTIGVICLISVFFLLNKINHQWFTKFSIGLIAIALVMSVVLINLFILN